LVPKPKALTRPRWPNFELAVPVAEWLGADATAPPRNGRRVWYLSADAENELPEELPAEGVIFIIGGLFLCFLSGSD
jgi:hypothetical protein